MHFAVILRSSWVIIIADRASTLISGPVRHLELRKVEFPPSSIQRKHKGDYFPDRVSDGGSCDHHERDWIGTWHSTSCECLQQQLKTRVCGCDQMSQPWKVCP